MGASRKRCDWPAPEPRRRARRRGARTTGRCAGAPSPCSPIRPPLARMIACSITQRLRQGANPEEGDMGNDVTVAENVPARMRDGTVLRADVYRPARGGPYPTLLARTPYGKGAREESKASYRALAAEGYLVAVQDVRGRFASEGEYRAYHPD